MSTAAQTRLSDKTYYFSVRLTRKDPTHEVKDTAILVIREQYLAPQE